VGLIGIQFTESPGAYSPPGVRLGIAVRSAGLARSSRPGLPGTGVLRSLPAPCPGVARVVLCAAATLSGLVFEFVVRTVARHTGAALLLGRLVVCLLAGAGLISPVLLRAGA
jgi:hypothetical protein